MIISEFTSRIRFIKRLLKREEFSSGQNSQENSEIDYQSPIRKQNMADCIFPNWPQQSVLCHMFFLQRDLDICPTERIWMALTRHQMNAEDVMLRGSER